MDHQEKDQSNQAGVSTALDKVNSEKNVLKSKTFKDGAIYLFVRGDYKKPTWMRRIKVSGRSGYIYRSTRTTSEHEAFKFADDLYHKELVKVLGGEKPERLDCVIADLGSDDEQRLARHRCLGEGP